jgi:alpha-L-fucosidase 2
MGMLYGVGEVHSLVAQEPHKSAPMVLWYRQPAAQWNAALPVGNGRLGAMVFGGSNVAGPDGKVNNGDSQDQKLNAEIADGHLTRAQDEHLQLNEATVWAGSRADRLNPRAGAAFPQIRKFLLEGKVAEAEKLTADSFISDPRGMPGYETLGDLTLRSMSDAPVKAYRRELDLNTGVVRVSYEQGGVRFTREIFASAAEQVIVVRLTASQVGALSFAIQVNRPEGAASATEGSDRLWLVSTTADPARIHFAGQVLALPTRGSVHAEGQRLVVDKADAVTLMIAAATDFKGGPFSGGDPKKACEAALQAARSKDVATMKLAAAADLQQYMGRAWLQLGSDGVGKGVDPLADLPTDERLKRASAGATDLHLEELYFQMGRYLLTQSSRPGGLPANLQGIWASGVTNPWGSKYTININTEMNYWPAEVTGLGDLTAPLFNLVDMVRTPGSGTGVEVARKYYGAGGLVAHHNTDIWGDANPIDGIGSGIWPMGGAWLSLHLWDHYAYTQDKAFLAGRAYPVLKQSSMFFLDYLTDDGQGHLVTGPSISPENKYLLPDGSVHSLSMGPTMDIEITRELLTRTIEASQLLGVDAALRARLETTRAKLLPFQIGKLGNLQEWAQDYQEQTPGHRHISHLWALYPGSQITLDGTPELAKAARVTLQRRLDNGGGQTGWSRAWVINYWDRLREGDQAYDSLQVLLRQSTFVNLLDDHPPGVFQIDGNEGAVAGMTGMLMDSRLESGPDGSLVAELDLLPALPSQWTEGSVGGLHARGGLLVSLQWSAGHATAATIEAHTSGRYRLRVPAGQSIRSLTSAGKAVRFESDHGLAVLPMLAGSSYRLSFR